MLGHLKTILEAMAADPDQRLATLSLLTQEERYKVLVTFNDNKTRLSQACLRASPV